MELRRLLHQVRCWLRVVFVLANNLYCIPTYLAWMWLVLYPLRLLIPPLYWALERQLFKLLLLMVSFWSWSAEYYGESPSGLHGTRRVELQTSVASVPWSEAELKSAPPLHMEWDSPPCPTTPNAAAMCAPPSPFYCRAGRSARGCHVGADSDLMVRFLLEKCRPPTLLDDHCGTLFGVVGSMPLGCRYARTNNYPILEHVTLPRIGAMKTVMETLSPENLAKISKG
ncbi:unnamed protein product, partial [Ixodes persulcatus]